VHPRIPMALACPSAVLLIAGCGLFRSETGYEASWRRSPANGDPTTMPRAGAEESLFVSAGQSEGPLSLDAAIALALRNDRQIHIARLNVGIAEDRIITARSFLLPQIKVGVGQTWLDEQPGFYDPENKVGFIAGEKATFRANVQLLVPIYDFGGALAQYRQTQLYRMNEQSVEERVRQEVVYEVSEAYFAILRAERLLQVAKESMKMTEAHLKQAKDFFAEGLVDKRDFLQAELRLAQVKQSLFRTENGYAMAISSFNKMIGRDINAPTRVVDVLEPRSPGLGLEDCMALAQNNRPELQQLRLRSEMAAAALRAAKAARYPRIYAVGGIHYNDDRYRLRETTQSVGLRMDVDVFSGGRVTAQISEAEKRCLQAEEAHKDLSEGLKLQVKGAYLGVDEARKKLAVTGKAIAQAEENLRISKNQYAENVISSTEVLDAQTLLTRARSDHHQALSYLNAAMARLEWALGTKLPAPENAPMPPPITGEDSAAGRVGNNEKGRRPR